ncbi:hypothetical protein D3C73_684920 [compost metagenome]
MNTFKDSCWLALDEIKRTWIYLALGVVFYLYSVIMINIMSSYYDESKIGAASSIFEGIFLNFFVLAIIQNLGFIMTRRYFHVGKKDSFTKQLAYLKLLPLSTKVIVGSRMIQFLITLLIMTSFFFIAYYTLLKIGNNKILMEIPYIPFALFWMGYAMIAGSLNLYWELGVSGKAYLRNCIIMCFPYVAISVGMWFWLENSFWLESIRWVQGYGVLLSLSMVLVGVICLTISSKLLQNKLDRRDLHG